MMIPRPTVLVATATGAVGSCAVQRARDAGYAVRAFVRNPRRRIVREFQQRGIEIVRGDFLDHDSLRRAVQGIEYVMSAAGALKPEGHATPGRVVYEGNAALIDAALQSGVRQFVLVSTMGAARLRDSSIFEAQNAAELTLAASGLNYTILRSSESMLTIARQAERFRRNGVYWVMGSGEHRISPISPNDLALIAVRALGNENAARRIFRVGGPETLCWRDIPAILSRIYERPARVRHVPGWLISSVRTTIRPFLSSLNEQLGLFSAYAHQDFVADAEEVRAIETSFGIQLEHLEDYLRRGDDTRR
ncbi:MAG: NAD(P)H-binding protein [Chloroflexales bacterium]|nr:NAD(P)H-binding protein [Chloroflexales bacterium]